MDEKDIVITRHDTPKVRSWGRESIEFDDDGEELLGQENITRTHTTLELPGRVLDIVIHEGHQYWCNKNKTVVNRFVPNGIILPVFYSLSTRRLPTKEEEKILLDNINYWTERYERLSYKFYIYYRDNIKGNERARSDIFSSFWPYKTIRSGSGVASAILGFDGSKYDDALEYAKTFILNDSEYWKL